MEPEGNSKTALTEVPDTETPVIEQFTPFQQRYLSYRLCGFGMVEACRHSDVSVRAVEHWRKTNEQFAHLDLQELPQLKRREHRRIIRWEFIRNFKLILKKDSEVIEKSLSNPEELTGLERNYLYQIRRYYTPQQLAILSQWAEIEPGTPSEWSFTQVVLNYMKLNNAE